MRNALRVLGILSAAIYAVIAALSLGFRESTAPPERPIPIVLALFAISCLIYLLALAWVARFGGRSRKVESRESDAHPTAFREVLLFAILFRLILLLSVPIQEVDFYRYLWDGRVLSNGLNPYRVAPVMIDHVQAESPTSLKQLAAVRDASSSTREIFDRVHHRHVPTIYPPLAQAFFALCAAVTPASLPVWAHLLVLKGLLIAVDVAILYSMRGLLRLVGMSDAWCLAYGWCPLAIKEVANSAHVDGLAVLFTLLSLQLFLKSSQGKLTENRPRIYWALAGGLLGMAILSKTYPIILLPVAASFAIAKIRAWAIVPLLACAALVAAGYLPFLDHRGNHGTAEAVSTEKGEPWTGLQAFLTQWQMNDLLFMLAHENLRQPNVDTGRWFVVTPRVWRAEISQGTAEWIRPLELGPQVDPAFIATQVLMSVVLLGIVLHSCWRVLRRPEPSVLLQAAFIVLAWSWMLGSAQNPWYVLWFLPLMPFARLRSWFLVPCLALIYYLRFWLVSQGEWNPATGECPAFDYGAVWFEHGIVLVALALESWIRRSPGEASTHSGTAAGSSSGGAASASLSSDA